MHGDLTLRSLVRCSADQTISSCPDILAPPSLASSSSHGIHMSLTLLVSLVSFLSSPTDGHAGVVSPASLAPPASGAPQMRGMMRAMSQRRTCPTA